MNRREISTLKIGIFEPKNIIWLLALTATSCNILPQGQNPLPIKSAICPEKPVESLSGGDVKNIVLNQTPVKESGSISAGKMRGFIFKAISGQQLKYKTSENLCIWVFAQDNQLVTSKTLNADGNYTLQITVPQGTTTFELEMSLDSKIAEVPKTVATSTPLASQSQPVAASPAITNTKDQQIDEIADRLFYEKYPELGGRKIKSSETTLLAEWNQIRKCDAIVDFIFYKKNSGMQGRKIRKDQTNLVNEWWLIRDGVSGCN